MPSEPVRFLARPLISDPATDNELDSALTREVCLARVEVELIELVKNSARPLNTEAPMDMEPVKVLNIDVCLVRLEDAPSVAVSSSALPLANEATRPIDPDNDLANPLVSDEARVREPARFLVRPFV